MIPKANVTKVVIEDLQHKRWIVYAKGISCYAKRSYKSYNLALQYASRLMNYYQIGNATEINR